MAKITDPDLLNQGVEVEFITGSERLIKLNAAGNLDPNDGVTMQALYSFCKEEWRTDDNLIKFPFPFVSITSEEFELQNDWDLSGSYANSLTNESASKNMIRDAGWTKVDAAGNPQERFMNITTLGTFDAATDQAYYLQSGSAGYPPTSSIFPDIVNAPIRIYASGAEYGGDPIIDFRDFFYIYLREQGKTYAFYDLNTEQNITTLTARKFALPLTNTSDTKITATDDTITGSAPYTGMSITYFTESFTRTIGSETPNFKVLIDGNNGTAEQIYEFVQYSLRQTGSIDAGDNLTTVRGDTAQELLAFSGDTLTTQRVRVAGSGSAADGVSYLAGVFIDNFQTADTNRLVFTDDNGVEQTFPFVAAGTINFNDNLQNDPSSSYFVFFTNDDDGDDTGRDFGTQDAIIINDNSGNPLTGSVDASESKAFDYDYDNNVQRGNASSGSNAPFTAVALGLDTAQYVVTTGTITRSTTNAINFVAALERNYLND